MLENEEIIDNEIQEKKEPQKIEVITGNGDLNISPVYDHIEVEKPKAKKKETILIPEVKKKISK